MTCLIYKYQCRWRNNQIDNHVGSQFDDHYYNWHRHFISYYKTQQILHRPQQHYNKRWRGYANLCAKIWPLNGIANTDTCINMLRHFVTHLWIIFREKKNYFDILFDAVLKIWSTKSNVFFVFCHSKERRCHDRRIVGFITTYAFNAYYH
jgi:hypothetical protein